MTDDNLARARGWIEPVVERIVRYADVDADPHAERPLLDVEEVIAACAAALAAAVRAKGEADILLFCGAWGQGLGNQAVVDYVRTHAGDVPSPPEAP